MKKSIWVIEQGSYSSYRVVGVFSSKNNAQAVLDKIMESKEYVYGDPQIAEWPMDPGSEEINSGLSLYAVLMTKDGTAERVEKRGVNVYNLCDEIQLWERTKAPAYRDSCLPDVLNATVWARDCKHAIKIVNEHRVQWIATGKWK